MVYSIFHDPAFALLCSPQQQPMKLYRSRNIADTFSAKIAMLISDTY